MSTVFYFGGDDRRLFGVYSCGSTQGTRRKGLLFCNPFGQEAIRIHRLFRALSERLTRDGVSTLRFDFFGTGDSSGEDAAAELEGWQEDLRQAHDQLARRSGAEEITWFGAGLGASVAVLGCQGSHPPNRLVLWNPVVNGAAYLDQLRLKHIQALEASYSFPDRSWREKLLEPTAFTCEASGFEISPRLREQLAGLNLSNLPRAALDLQVVADPLDACLSHWIEHQQPPGQAVTVTPLAETFDWSAERLQGTALVPHSTFSCLLQVLGEQR
jgi:uncharacterized protein